MTATTPDFYTIGYSGRTIEQFIATLHHAGVKTLVDVRHLPVRRWTIDFSTPRLRGHVERAGLTYVHMQDTDIPSCVRATNEDEDALDELWNQYARRVMDFIYNVRLRMPRDRFSDPYALMCTEADPLTCHRHRLALALERLGLRGVDL